MSLFSSEMIIALLAIVLHVANYNVTAQIEYNTKVFTKLIGRDAIYYYAVYLVFSALVRDHYIQVALMADAGTIPFLPHILGVLIGGALFVFGFLLNLWTLYALGIKGMYNGDSFGHLFDAPVKDGPYQYLSDPQYVGTTVSMLGSALYYQSMDGILLTLVLGFTFYVSVKFIEGPHMKRVYSERYKTKRPNNIAQIIKTRQTKSSSS